MRLNKNFFESLRYILHRFVPEFNYMNAVAVNLGSFLTEN